LLLCWHHFEELLRHGDNAVVARRIAFFRSLSMIASIAPIATDGALGSVLDILIFEVAEAFKDPHASSITIRDRVMQKLFRYKKGSEVVGPYVAFLGPMREEFRRREELNREIVAISRSRYIDIGKTKVTDWLKGRWREPEDAEKRLASMSRQLADDIRKHGDKRISDASAIATRFIDSVRSNAGMAQGSRKHPPADKLLPEDVDNVDIGPDMTVDELGDLAVFRRRLRLANAILDLPWPDLKARVTETRLPSGLIQSTLQCYRQDLPERKGSELNDQYLVCLAPYADITYVDKRTHEAVLRARRGSPEFTSVVGRIEKAANYGDIAGQLVGDPVT
jgi:hypothetical protein